MTHTLIYGFDKELAGWAQQRIPWMQGTDGIRAVGVAEGPTPGDKLLAVVFYSNYRAPFQLNGKTWGGICEMGIAAASPRWATRGTIASLLGIPFEQYNCRKVVAVVPSTNRRSVRLAEGLGFKQEGTLRHHFAKDVHACVLGMMRGEFEKRWLHPRQPKAQANHGQPTRRWRVTPALH